MKKMSREAEMQRKEVAGGSSSFFWLSHQPRLTTEAETQPLLKISGTWRMRSFVIWAAPVSRTSQRNVEGHTNLLPARGPLQATPIKPGAPVWVSAGPVPASIFIGIRSLSLPEWRGGELSGLLRPRIKVSQLYLGLHAFGLPFVSVECCATVALLCKIPFPVLLMGSFDLKWRETKWRELTFT